MMTPVSRFKPKSNGDSSKVRYAVVGLGYISQAAMLPAFAHAKGNSQLTALISSDPLKLKKLGKKYKVENLFVYEEFEIALRSNTFDAVYIALPNSMHAQYTIAALEAGIHVLCEKPMAPTSRECEAMQVVAQARKMKLMIAYRLHFEEANLEAMRIARSGKLGDLRFFSSTFTMNVKPGDIRLRSDLAGGPIPDIGIYCINAARNLFRDEPLDVSATAVSSDDRRFREVPEMVSVTMRFPQNRVATFLCGFNSAKVSEYRIVGTHGELLVEPGYELADDLKHRLRIGDRIKTRNFPKRDQFAPELEHFSDCILNDENPGPGGLEGLADVRIIEAISLAIQTGKAEQIRAVLPPTRPSPAQENRKRPVKMPELVAASPPNKH
jgi:predicted dehydrogenase